MACSVKSAALQPGTAVMKCGAATRAINVAQLTAAKKFADYRGKRFYLPSLKCATEFKKDPAAFARRHTGFAIPKATKTAKGA